MKDISIFDVIGPNMIGPSSSHTAGALRISLIAYKMMKSDVYIWKMEATFLDGQTWEGFDAGNGKKTKFGSVTLIR